MHEPIVNCSGVCGVCGVLNAVLKQQQDKMAVIQQAVTQQSLRTAPWQQSAAGPVQTSVLQDQLEQQRAVAMEQIQQSETNLAAQYQSIMQQQQVQLCVDFALCCFFVSICSYKMVRRRCIVTPLSRTLASCP